MKNKPNLFKKLAILLAIVGLVAGTAAVTTYLSTKDTSSVTAKSKAKKKFTRPRHTNQGAKRVFLNASQNRNGNTSNLAKKVFGNSSYKQINLADYHIPQVGEGNGDFKKVWDQLKDADVIVIGTPVYWSNMSGYLKTFIDHLEVNNDLKGSDLYVLVQGADSNQTRAINATYGTLNRVSIRLGLNFVGIAQTDRQANTLHNKMIGKK